MALRDDSECLTSLPNASNLDLVDDDDDGPLWVKEIHQQHDEEDDVTRLSLFLVLLPLPTLCLAFLLYPGSLPILTRFYAYFWW